MHLTDCFMELVAYGVYFQKTGAAKQPPFEQVKADVMRLLTASEDYVRRGLVTQEDYDQARFVVCAWMDETILSSSWNQRGQWQREQLQRLYYNTTEAGEEVFERLNSLGLHQKEIREVFYLCMALGFKGRFVKQGDEFLLDQLKSSNLKLLLGSSVGIPSLERSDLFPEAYPAEAPDLGPRKQKFRFTPTVIAALGGPVALFGVLFLIYYFTLNGIGDNVVRMVR